MNPSHNHHNKLSKHSLQAQHKAIKAMAFTLEIIYIMSLQPFHMEVEPHLSFHAWLPPAFLWRLSSYQFLFKAPMNLPSSITVLRRSSVGPALSLLPSGSPLMLAGVSELCIFLSQQACNLFEISQ